MIERTLAIIKPRAVARNIIGDILKMMEENHLKIVALKMIHMDRKVASGFYYVHKDKPFFSSLVKFMTSGPVVVAVLEGKDAITRYRKLMGSTNPDKADEGTIRKKYAESLQANAVHGSDSPESANYEISFFFNATELRPYHH